MGKTYKQVQAEHGSRGGNATVKKYGKGYMKKLAIRSAKIAAKKRKKIYGSKNGKRSRDVVTAPDRG